MNAPVYVNDQLWHRWKRTFPTHDLGAFLRQAMTEAIKEREREDEARRWNPVGLAGRERTSG